MQDYGNKDVAINAMNSTGNRFKKIAYNYDLISGKVNKVSYQPGYADEFYHRYTYDAENRITMAETSHDDILWERDARYTYYKHGPLARTILGEEAVQGIDYAYTLQGWLKGVNTTGLQGGDGNIGQGEDCGPASAVDNLVIYNRETTLPDTYKARTSISFMPSGFESAMPDNFVASIDPNLASCGSTGTAGTLILPSGNLGQYDMGQDGRTNASNQPVNTNNNPLYGNNTRTLDAYGYSLNYFDGDYNKISTSTQAPNPFVQITNGAGLSSNDPLHPTVAKDLFNGNISAMAVSIPQLGKGMVYGYSYDQLNRITSMTAFSGLTSANTFTPVALDKYRENISYDANGNILTYKRNGNDARLYMDDMTYTYKPNTNQLDKVVDAAPDAAASDYDKYNDIKKYKADGITPAQANSNYTYDAIGNLISDASEGITNIGWTVYGKISSITKVKDGSTTTITYTYDASGNRISKSVIPPSGGGGAAITTYYVRDASGNVMSVYTATPITGPSMPGAATANVVQAEIHLYGSSRLGIYNINRNVTNLTLANHNTVITFTKGNKIFELSNHLGNILETVSDKKLAVDSDNDGLVNYYNADVVTATDFYPFGMTMPGRKYTAGGGYRYGFNGKENDKDAGEGIQDYGMRIYDCRLGRFLSVDQLTKSYPTLTPYQFASNSVISGIDLEGLEYYFTADGTLLGKFGNSNEIRIITNEEVQKQVSMDMNNVKIDKTISKLYEQSVKIGSSRTVSETVNVYDRAKANGGRREEVSLVTKAEGILRGTKGPEPKTEFDKDGTPKMGEAPSQIPTTLPPHTLYVEDPNTTLKITEYNKLAKYLNTPEAIIHSHPLETVVKENPDNPGNYAYWAFSTKLSTGKNADLETLQNRSAELFIVVGRLTPNTVNSIQKKDGREIISETQGTAGASYYDKNGSKQLDMKISSLKKIVSQTTQ